MRQSDQEDTAAVLRELGWTVKPPPEPEPEKKCSRCGLAESETEYGRLTDVRAVVADGEEGHSDVTLFLCDDNGCLPDMIDGLMALGFKSHRHGGTTFLADDEKPDCGGYEGCDIYDRESGGMREEY